MFHLGDCSGYFYRSHFFDKSFQTKFNDSSARHQTAFFNSLTATDLPGSWLLALGFLAPGFLAPGFLAPGSRLPGSWLPGSWLLAPGLEACEGTWMINFCLKNLWFSSTDSINLLTLRGVVEGRCHDCM